MLDENLGGGVSLQKNIAELPEAIRPRILEAPRGRRARRAADAGPRRAGTREFAPARRRCSRRSTARSSRAASYARQPEAMIDVGNDREFGFLYEPPLDVLERTFTALFAADLPAEARRQALQLCSFFKVPERTAAPALQARLLDALADPDAGVRETARQVVGRDLAFAGTEDDPRLVAKVRSLLGDSRSGESRAAVLGAIGRTRRLTRAARDPLGDPRPPVGSGGCLTAAAGARGHRVLGRRAAGCRSIGGGTGSRRQERAAR